MNNRPTPTRLHNKISRDQFKFPNALPSNKSNNITYNNNIVDGINFMRQQNIDSRYLPVTNAHPVQTKIHHNLDPKHFYFKQNQQFVNKFQTEIPTSKKHEFYTEKREIEDNYIRSLNDFKSIHDRPQSTRNEKPLLNSAHLLPISRNIGIPFEKM